MPTMRVLKVCCGAVALVLAAWSFVACGSRGEPEITEDRAVKSAVAFVKRLGLDADVAKPRVRRTRTSVYPNPPYDVSFADAGTVAVDARTGSVLSYWRSNLAPPPAGGGRKPPPLDTDAQIDAYMKALAKRLGATDKMVYSGARRRGWDPATTV